LSQLAELLMERFDVTGNLGDLDEPVRWFRQALAATEPGTVRYAGRLSNLGQALLGWYERTHRPADLDEAVDLFARAVDLVTVETAARGTFLSGLGAALEYPVRGSWRAGRPGPGHRGDERGGGADPRGRNRVVRGESPAQSGTADASAVRRQWRAGGS